jgi:lipoyl(octanoyl) transferase
VRSAGDWKSFHVDDVPEEGRFLMGRDTARLEALEADPSLGPSLFLYRWAAPTISLGYAQREERVLDPEAVRAQGMPVVRRPTGGRAILHVDEWTYGVAVPLGHPRLGGNLKDSLTALSAIVAAALAEVGVKVESVSGREAPPGGEGAEEACFRTALGHELSAAGRKLAGAAQRRLSQALLTQGTILAGPGHERLADFLAGDPASKRLGLERLLEGTVTVKEIAPRATFRAFAEALGRAWEEGSGR